MGEAAASVRYFALWRVLSLPFLGSLVVTLTSALRRNATSLRLCLCFLLWGGKIAVGAELLCSRSPSAAGKSSLNPTFLENVGSHKTAVLPASLRCNPSFFASTCGSLDARVRLLWTAARGRSTSNLLFLAEYLSAHRQPLCYASHSLLLPNAASAADTENSRRVIRGRAVLRHERRERTVSHPLFSKRHPQAGFQTDLKRGPGTTLSFSVPNPPSLHLGTAVSLGNGTQRGGVPRPSFIASVVLSSPPNSIFTKGAFALPPCDWSRLPLRLSSRHRSLHYPFRHSSLTPHLENQVSATALLERSQSAAFDVAATLFLPTLTRRGFVGNCRHTPSTHFSTISARSEFGPRSSRLQPDRLLLHKTYCNTPPETYCNTVALAATSSSLSSTDRSTDLCLPTTVGTRILPRDFSVARIPDDAKCRSNRLPGITAIPNRLCSFVLIATARAALRQFVSFWAQHSRPILLGGVFILRFFKLLLYARYLFEWLPQVNPYLQPFQTIYAATDAYMGLFQALIPPVLGIDLSGLTAWLVLEFTESVLSGNPQLAELAST